VDDELLAAAPSSLSRGGGSGSDASAAAEEMVMDMARGECGKSKEVENMFSSGTGT
jgi:hypothetical protein